MPKDKQPGNLYHQPVILGLEHGVTFASSDQDAFNLQSAVAGQIKDAQVRGNPVILRSILGYVAASRSTGSVQAFESATKFLVANMLRSLAKKLEIEMLYGQVGYGTVASTTSNTIVITTSEWAPGIWGGSEGMPIELRSSDGTTSRGTFTISSVNMSTRTLTLDASVPSSVVANDVVWHRGAYGNEFPGIHFILSNVSQTLFNINAANYALWQGNIYPAGSAALSFAKLTQAAALPVEKGLDTSLYCLVNVRGWTNLLQGQAALRMYDSSFSTSQLENGSQKLKFFSQNGEMEIEPSIFVKEGYCYLLAIDEWTRVGSSDMTFRRPGQGDEFFRDLENSAGYELRLYSDQAIFTAAPGKNCLITGIVNNA